MDFDTMLHCDNNVVMCTPQITELTTVLVAKLLTSTMAEMDGHDKGIQ